MKWVFIDTPALTLENKPLFDYYEDVLQDHVGVKKYLVLSATSQYKYLDNFLLFQLHHNTKTHCTVHHNNLIWFKAYSIQKKKNKCGHLHHYR